MEKSISAHLLSSGSTGYCRAISVEGTLCGMGAVFLLSVVALLLSVVSVQAFPAVVLGGWFGFYMESYVGAYWTEEGEDVSNEWMNILNTFLGGTLALIIAYLTGVL